MILVLLHSSASPCESQSRVKRPLMQSDRCHWTFLSADRTLLKSTCASTSVLTVTVNILWHKSHGEKCIFIVDLSLSIENIIDVCLVNDKKVDESL